MTRTATRSARAVRHRRRRRTRRVIVTLVVIVVLAVLADFGARLAAENVLAEKIEQQGLDTRPDVSILGFPFLTQVASKDFSRVDITAAKVAAGPVTISTINATATGIKLDSYAFSSGTISNLAGTVLISFGSLGNTLAHQAGGFGSVLKGAGLDLTDAGPDEVKASAHLAVFSMSATWRVTSLPGNRLMIRLVSTSGDLPASLLGNIQNMTLTIPKLPLDLTINSVRVTPQGVVGMVTGRDVPFGS